jgi:hypothetical protein
MSKTEFYLNAEVVEIWVYNKFSGEIYIKQSIYSNREFGQEALDSEASLIATTMPKEAYSRIDNIFANLAKLTKELSEKRRLYANGVGSLLWIGELRKVLAEIESVNKILPGQYLKFKLNFSGNSLQLAGKFLMAKDSAIKEFELLSQEDKDFMIKTWSLEGFPISSFSLELGLRSYIFQNDAKFMWDLVKQK